MSEVEAVIFPCRVMRKARIFFQSQRVCGTCGIGFIRARHQISCSKKCNSAAMTIRDAAYNRSERGKASTERYAQSEKGKTTLKRYRESNAWKISLKRYRESDFGRLRRKERKYNRKQSGGGQIDLRAWNAKMQTLGHVCQICQKKLDSKSVTIDHIFPLSKGGTNKIDNLQPLCMPCNSRKGAKIL